MALAHAGREGSKSTNRRRTILAMALVAVGVCVLDAASKRWALAHLGEGDQRFGDAFRLTLMHNKHLAWASPACVFTRELDAQLELVSTQISLGNRLVLADIAEHAPIENEACRRRLESDRQPCDSRPNIPQLQGRLHV